MTERETGNGRRRDDDFEARAGVDLGLLGYFLGAGRIGVATILLSILAMFAGLIVDQLIPGFGGDDRGFPAREPAAKSS